MTSPRAWAIVDESAVAHNVGLLRSAAPSAELCAVVKANGYGHGAATIATVALAAGATRLGVAQVQEGVELRAAGISAPIIVLSQPAVAELSVAADHGLEPTVYTEEAIDAGNALGLSMHLKVDTGMRRSGCSVDEVVTLARRATPASVWTHLAVADEPGHRHTAVQLARYDDAVERVLASDTVVGLRHAANTAATLLEPSAHYDMVRCGIGLYGLAPSAAQIGQFDFRPALQLETTVGFVKRLSANERVSYGLRGSVSRSTTVATLPVGYADGVRRALWRDGVVLVGGKRRPIVGVVTMDQIVVDCGDDEVSIGDQAVLIGRQGEESISADDWAGWLDTINYEIVCGVTSRVGRRVVT